jgi:hypothetical protein
MTPDQAAVSRPAVTPPAGRADGQSPVISLAHISAEAGRRLFFKILIRVSFTLSL